jgi:hypothetical protein
MNADDPNKKIPDETGEESDISPAERSLLDESLTNSLSVDNNNLRRSAIDLTDADGDPLNEASSNLAGDDLDVPGAELDDAQEEIGEEDEENNFYSNADTE